MAKKKATQFKKKKTKRKKKKTTRKKSVSNSVRSVRKSAAKTKRKKIAKNVDDQPKVIVLQNTLKALREDLALEKEMSHAKDIQIEKLTDRVTQLTGYIAQGRFKDIEL